MTSVKAKYKCDALYTWNDTTARIILTLRHFPILILSSSWQTMREQHKGYVEEKQESPIPITITITFFTHFSTQNADAMFLSENMKSW